MIVPFNPVTLKSSTIIDKTLCFFGRHDWVTRGGSGVGSLYYQCRREHCKKFRIWSSRFGWIDDHKPGEINVRMILDRKMEIQKEKWDLCDQYHVLPEEGGRISNSLGEQRLRELAELENRYSELYEQYKLEVRCLHRKASEE